ncbi:hypothetical protein BROUX41_003536 [Berkeleyomyces rouxiae]
MATTSASQPAAFFVPFVDFRKYRDFGLNRLKNKANPAPKTATAALDSALGHPQTLRSCRHRQPCSCPPRTEREGPSQNYPALIPSSTLLGRR